MSMDAVFGIDAWREMKRRAVVEVFWRPGVLGADLIGELNSLFQCTDAEEALWELINSDVIILSAEGSLWLASGRKPE